MDRPAMHHPSTAPKSWLARFGWMMAIWVVSVLALGIAALAFRLIMNLAGLTV